MKALTVCEPMASAIIFGGKIIENRRALLALPPITLIHAGKSLDWFTAENCEWLHQRWSGCPANPVAAMHLFKVRMGKVIGIVRGGQGFRHNEPHPTWLSRSHLKWMTGPTCIPVDHATPVTPFQARGSQGVFNIPNELIPQEVFDKAEDITQAVAEAEERCKNNGNYAG